MKASKDISGRQLALGQSALREGAEQVFLKDDFAPCALSADGPDVR